MTIEGLRVKQSPHKEADTLITFFASQLAGNILVRASDTDVLTILLGYLGNCRPEVAAKSQIVMDCGVKWGLNLRFQLLPKKLWNFFSFTQKIFDLEINVVLDI